MMPAQRRASRCRTWGMKGCADLSFGQHCNDRTASRRVDPLEVSRFVAPPAAATGCATVIRGAVHTGTGRARAAVDCRVVLPVPAILGRVRLGPGEQRTVGPCCRITPAVDLPTGPRFTRGKPAKPGLPATGRSDPSNCRYPRRYTRDAFGCCADRVRRLWGRAQARLPRECWSIPSTVLEVTSGLTGQDFFASLVRHLAAALDVWSPSCLKLSGEGIARCRATPEGCPFSQALTSAE